MLKRFWENSQTKTWSYIQASSGTLILTLGELHNWISDPTIKEYLGQLDLPKAISIGLIVLGLITYVCHGHND